MKTIIILLLNISLTFAVNFSEYFDLRIGNVYVYDCMLAPSVGGSTMHKMKIVITDTLNYSGKKYFHFSRQLVRIYGTGNYSMHTFPFDVGYYSVLRIDTLSGMIYFYNPNNGCFYSPNETMLDSLNSKLNDVVNIRCVQAPYYYTCTDTTGVKKYVYSNMYIRTYTRGQGLTYDYLDMHFWRSYNFLTGSVINGSVWGDTGYAFTSLKNISTEIPETFSLSQNYPNPFNPTTKIKFSIPSPSSLERAGVRLVIYDALGKEVQTLVNEHLQPGTYEVEWDASNFSSGVYYYTISSGEFNETQKMVLIK